MVTCGSNLDIYNFICKLYPIFRSITGEGVRTTLKEIKKIIPINIYEIPSGTKVFDWEIPKEWIIRDAYVADMGGKKVIDIHDSNIHLLNYSIPIHNRKMPIQELKPHIFTLPEYPDWIPYRTSYYHDNWGFCTSENAFRCLNDPFYEVCIDTDHVHGSLSYGELFIPGETEEEILFSTYICHPSLCNDNLSGVAVLTFLAQWLMQEPRRFSYRILFIPETIGAIAWLSTHLDLLKRIKWGMVLTCLGDPGPFTYKKTKNGDSIIDNIVQKVLLDSGKPFSIIDFFPLGSDERQFSSPGINIPFGSLMRTMYEKFPEYHTSADNLEFIAPKSLNESLELYCNIVDCFEGNGYYVNLCPFCEPQLGKRGLYYEVGAQKNRDLSIDALLWLLNYCDGTHSLLDIATKSGIKLSIMRDGVHLLLKNGLLKQID